MLFTIKELVGRLKGDTFEEVHVGGKTLSVSINAKAKDKERVLHLFCPEMGRGLYIEVESALLGKKYKMFDMYTTRVFEAERKIFDDLHEPFITVVKALYNGEELPKATPDQINRSLASEPLQQKNTLNQDEDLWNAPDHILKEQLPKVLADMILDSRPFQAILRIIEPVEITVSPRDPAYLVVKTVDGIGFSASVEKKFMAKKLLFKKITPTEDGDRVEDFGAMGLDKLYYDVFEAIVNIGSFSKIGKDDYHYSFRSLLESEAR